MNDERKTKAQLIDELKQLRTRVEELEREINTSMNKDHGVEIDWRLSFIAKHSDLVGIWNYNLENGEFYVNPEWYENLGCSSEQMEPNIETWERLVHSEDLQLCRDSMNALVKGEISFASFQFRMLSGSEDWKQIHCKGIVSDRNEDREAQHAFGILIDLTGWQFAVELYEEREKFSKVLRELFGEMIANGTDISNLKELWSSDFPLGAFDHELLCLHWYLADEYGYGSKKRGRPFFVKDLSMKYVHVSPAFAELLGTTPSRMLGQTDDQLYGTEEQGIFEKLIPAIKTEKVGCEVRLREAKGKKILFIDCTRPMDAMIGEDTYYIHGLSEPKLEITNDLRLVRIGESPYVSEAMLKTLEMALLAAQSDEVVLLTGESGTGKDYLAKYIHKNSRRSEKRFLPINCAAIPSELAESELFGHERGAFTTALSQKKGLVELADGGTLFLNEIGELTLPMQAKLLTFLDSGEFIRVGSEKKRKADIRILAATNRDLETEVFEKRFREDLFHRLNVIRIVLPTLRERKEDIAILAQQFLAELNAEYDEERDIDPKAIRLLEELDYQGGNVRQLKNLFRRARVLTRKQMIDAKALFGDLSEKLRPKVGQWRTISEVGNSEDWEWRTDFPRERSYNQVVQDLRRSLIKEALRRVGGSAIRAGHLLGLTKDAMRKQMETLGIKASNRHPK